MRKTIILTDVDSALRHYHMTRVRNTLFFVNLVSSAVWSMIVLAMQDIRSVKKHF